MIQLHAERMVRAGLDRRRLWDVYRDTVLLVYYRREFQAARHLLWDYWREHPLDFQILRYAFVSLLPSRWVNRLRGRAATAGEAAVEGEPARRWEREVGKIQHALAVR
jgi:hypothetical protein